ncbi:interleukin-27 subunit beta isoform X2 [Pezoporus flaviventris]|uniref:interleukin-27 subunit beta isoform X2 n=1 Tax=Pezoporus flaviventris TaxID=889875 RepID=UPI002AB0359F|nr:interleukin-27 subunit beta isoform X2 [Pezoporus flaviventris]
MKLSWPEPKPLSCGSGPQEQQPHVQGLLWGHPWQRVPPLGTTFPVRGSGLRPAGTVASRCSAARSSAPGAWSRCDPCWNWAALLRLLDMRWLWVVALVAPACTMPYNSTGGSTGDGDNGDRDPPAPPALQCWAISYPQAVNCSWALAPEPLLDTDFVATYRHGTGGDTEVGECIPTGPRSCSFGNVQVFSLIPYVVNVTAVNALGAASSILPFLLESIIKPDPPEALRVSPIPGETTKLLLEWSPPGSWPFPEYFPLRYRIRYAQEDGSVTAMVGPYEQTSLTLSGLRPGALLHVQVAAKDFTDSGELSAWSAPAAGMPWMEP